ncbi:MAG: TolC family protein, partial [Paramuribaculum sp.]|nr:TolC family protein [Paramuribaculum sp.]
MLRRLLNIIVLSWIAVQGINASEKVTLTLSEAVRLANDSSLTAFRYQNLYASGYWEWRTFKANRLPSLSLSLTPARYYRYISQRYNSTTNEDVFRTQHSYSADGGLSASQNVDFLGGSLYMETDLEYLRNFGDTKNNQFSSVPFRIGYRQELIGFNGLKWEKKIEPVKYEKVKREFIYN